MHDQAVIVLGRFPKKGQVKTRLAKEIGEDKALELYKTWLTKILAEVNQLKDNSDIYFYHSDQSNHQSLVKWLKDQVIIKSPKSQIIEENLESAFGELFMSGYKKIICLSSDVPDLNSQIISNAFRLLHSFDIVIGPDNDGGIYLFGTKKHYPHLFQNDYKKDDKVIDVLKSKLDKLGLKYHLLISLIDIDTQLDYETWQKTNN